MKKYNKCFQWSITFGLHYDKIKQKEFEKKLAY